MNSLMTISKKDQFFYQENGYLLTHKSLFSKEKFDQLESIFQEHLAESQKDPSYDMDVPHFRDKRLFEFLMAPEVMEVIAGIIGPNIGLWSSHFISKEPFKGKRTPWHEDSAYWNGRFDRFDGIVTLWLSIDGSDIENGCMGVVPGSHVNGFSTYADLDANAAIFDSEISEEIDEKSVVWFELQKGHYSLHDSRIIHGAHENRSSRRRTGYTMRYFSTDMTLNPDHPGNQTHKVYYCQGENHGNNPLLHI
ncbi:MAG: phytanoyl-CoA dioxygenase family protein [Bacteroidota bacterium]